MNTEFSFIAKKSTIINKIRKKYQIQSNHFILHKIISSALKLYKSPVYQISRYNPYSLSWEKNKLVQRQFVLRKTMNNKHILYNKF